MRKPVKIRNTPNTKTSQVKAESRAVPATTNIARNTIAPDHAVEEHVVAVALGYGEAGEDHAEHEDVVQREALLQQVGGEVRFGPLHAGQEPHEPSEGEGNRYPEHRQPQRLAEGHLPRVPVEHEEVEEEQRKH